MAYIIISQNHFVTATLQDGTVKRIPRHNDIFRGKTPDSKEKPFVIDTRIQQFILLFVKNIGPMSKEHVNGCTPLPPVVMTKKKRTQKLNGHLRNSTAKRNLSK